MKKRDFELLKKYPNISISDIEAAKKYAIQTRKELLTDIEAFKKNMTRNWKIEITKRDMEIMAAKNGMDLIVEMFISARSACTKALSGMPLPTAPTS